ncbi:hypothetical protein H4219_001340 [Mycoemilia scoparia]|uniref:Mitochondrial carrier n=1 Tax=Mycoemilia scoparia TaxID=417184 RepID=A0A9W8DW58_9FUNG|nr:hypothetical protein H4219_001340 [Mycoemilia scoparia]
MALDKSLPHHLRDKSGSFERPKAVVITLNKLSTPHNIVTKIPGWFPIRAIRAQNAVSVEDVAPAGTPTETHVRREANFKDRAIGFAAGICSGATKLVVGHPFDTVKVRLQTEGVNGRFNGLIDCIGSTVKKEGVRALYKGATPPLIGWSIMDAVQLGSLSNYRLFLQGNDKSRKLTHLENAIAGLGAGWTVALVATPVETLKVRLQTQYATGSGEKRLYAGPIDCARQLVRQNGIFGLWHGLQATLLQRSFFFFLWGSYSVYTDMLHSLKYTKSSLGIPYYAWDPPKKTAAANSTNNTGRLSEKAISFLAGGLAANTFWTFCFPFDVVKNRYMRNNTIPKPSLAMIAKQIYRTEGIRGFFTGFGVTFVRSFPTNASAIFVFEYIMRLANSR